MSVRKCPSCRFSHGQIICRFVLAQILLFFYLCGGAVIFQSIEGPNEIEAQRKIEQYKTQIQDFFSGESYRADTNVTTVMKKRMFRRLLEEYERRLYQNFQLGITTENKRWDFLSACVFSLTVITTIGYGHMVPATDTGRMFCIFYALIGIPSFLIYLTVMGQLVAMALKSVSRSLTHALKMAKLAAGQWKHKSHKTSPVENKVILTNWMQIDEFGDIATVSGNLVRDVGEISNHGCTNQNEKTEASSLDSEPSTMRKKIADTKQNHFGQVPHKVYRVNSDTVLRNYLNDFDDYFHSPEITQSIKHLEQFRLEGEPCCIHPRRRSWSDPTIAIPSFLVTRRRSGRYSYDVSSDVSNRGCTWCCRSPCGFHTSDLHTDACTSKKMAKTKSGMSDVVPTCILLIILIAYICAFAAFLTIAESEELGWDFQTSLYFCVITMTTIGFGDLIPTYLYNDGESAHQLIVVLMLFVIVGLVLMTGCFTLTQKGILQGMKKIKIKCVGLIDSCKGCSPKHG
ncbi:uncharacterized protein LOC144436871 [Glandiceps talaboti]